MGNTSSKKYLLAYDVDEATSSNMNRITCYLWGGFNYTDLEAERQFIAGKLVVNE